MKHGLILLSIMLGGCAISDQTPTPLPSARPSPVAMLVRLPIPADKRTVAEAAEYLLEPTPYHLVLRGPLCPPEAQEIAEKPVSPLAQNSSITSIQRALLMVAGSRTKLLIDDNALSITFAYASQNP